MSISATAPTKARKQFSVRRRVNRKIPLLSIPIGVVAVILMALAYVISVYPSIRSWKDVNERTLSEIRCTVAI